MVILMLRDKRKNNNMSNADGTDNQNFLSEMTIN